MSLRLLDATPRQGARWVSLAFTWFLKKPLAFSALLGVFLFAAMVSLMLPYVGAILVLMALPLLGLGFMIATRSALDDGPVHAGLLLLPLRASTPDESARRSALLKLCGLYALATALTMLIGDAIDAGAFERLQVLLASARTEAGQKEIDALLAEPSLRAALIWRMGVTALLSIPFWHAPALVWWHRHGIGKALFASTLACWRNRGAFLVYGLAWALTILLFGIVAGAVFALLGEPQLVPLAAIPAGLMFTTAFYVSLYFTFADCFAADPEAEPGGGALPPP